MRTVLFVCTGNTCRSPMAEAIAQRWLDSERPDDGDRCLAASAGLAAGSGATITAEAREALRRRGIEHEGRSKPLTADMIAAAEAVFVMTRGHLLAARGLVAGTGLDERIHLLDPAGDIADPFGMAQAEYDAVAERLARLIPERLEEVLPVNTTTKTVRTIALGADHRGRAAIKRIADHLAAEGHTVHRLGPAGEESTDYPDVAWAVGQAVGNGTADVGVLLCGSGIGVSMAANKVDGVRAALIGDRTAAEASRRHNDANVFCASADHNDVESLLAWLDVFLDTPFEGGRHARRVGKMASIERGVDPAKAG